MKPLNQANISKHVLELLEVLSHLGEAHWCLLGQLKTFLMTVPFHIWDRLIREQEMIFQGRLFQFRGLVCLGQFLQTRHDGADEDLQEGLSQWCHRR